MENIYKVNNRSLNTVIIQKQAQYDTHSGQSFGSMLNDSQLNDQKKDNQKSEALKSHQMALENTANLNRLLIISAA